MGVTLLQSPILHLLISSGARSALPMGVAPEAIVEKSFSSTGSRDNIARHTSTRNTSTSKFFNSRYFQRHPFVEFQSSTSMKSSIRYFVKITAPKAVIKRSFSYDPLYNFFICRRHLFTFYSCFYHVNDDVALH
jgi:hypothetical protein